jgi:hypothetical protein
MAVATAVISVRIIFPPKGLGLYRPSLYNRSKAIRGSFSAQVRRSFVIGLLRMRIACAVLVHAKDDAGEELLYGPRRVH